MAKKKKEGLFSKVIVSAVIGLNVLFVAAVLWVFHETGSEPSALVGSWFVFTTGELWSLAFIKCRKKMMAEREKEDASDNI